MGEVDAPDPVQLRKSILEWYATHKRILPWRAESFQAVNPYHVFVSEIMLQQTTVQTVIPYFLKFVGRFSNWTDLAAAKEDEVFSFWQGLGYYRRASNLHKAAKMVCEEHNEVLPATVDHLLRLPGVGAYTAKAVASIAFEQPVVPVDGNVVRVLARVFGIEDVLPILKKKVDEYFIQSCEFSMVSKRVSSQFRCRLKARPQFYV